jgi:ribosomal protein S18 acetylase RimI-like enzyme
MELYKTKILSDHQRAQVRILEKECRYQDGTKRELFLSNEFNYYKEMNCFFLLFQKSELIAVLTIFSPTERAAEISAQVMPDHRRKGCFSMLLASARKELQKFQIEEILFVHETESMAGKGIISKWNADLAHSEYHLRFEKREKERIRADEEDLFVRLAEENDLPRMADLDAAVFGESGEASAKIVTEAFYNDSILSFCIFYGSQLIGNCNVNLEGQSLSLFGLCIAPAYQRRGFGRFFLNHVIDMLGEYSGEITLEVDSNNKKAYDLYLQNGFSLMTQYDYYKVKNESCAP